MSAMKPDAWMTDDFRIVSNESRERMFKGLQEVYSEPLFTLDTVRKWLEQPPSKEMLESVFQLKANDPDKQDMADLMARVVHFDICERMLAAKLRELEGGNG